jgi:hypothetical protein
MAFVIYLEECFCIYEYSFGILEVLLIIFCVIHEVYEIPIYIYIFTKFRSFWTLNWFYHFGKKFSDLVAWRRESLCLSKVFFGLSSVGGAFMISPVEDW